ncbi:DNA repair protein RadA-like protein isoform X1 [Tasmannia lanceolata]|uniref:DNA repair protein RadA-like protein isoform X1 n=1 Tax=Tasmannia lanceolata TaxID=3420 RepID=UPI004062BB65
MQKIYHHHPPQISQMKTFRNLFSRELLNLTNTKFISNPIQKLRFSHHFHSSEFRTIHSTNRCQEQESNSDLDHPRVWSGPDSWADEFIPTDKDENPRVRSDFNPIAEKSVKPDEESSSGDENPRPLSSFDSQSRNSKPRVWSDLNSRAEKSVPSRTKGVENQETGMGFRAFGSVMKKKTGKNKVYWVCENCGVSHLQWWGTCNSCNLMGTLKQFSESEKVGNKTRGFDVSETAVRSWMPQRPDEISPRRLTDVNKGLNQSQWRIPLPGLFGMEVARVLGGGLVPGSLVLVGGDPGVGKSTLLLQIAAMLAEGHNFNGPASVIYVSGEESVEQIGSRADRMGIGSTELFLYSCTDVEDILEKIQVLSPRALIVDSIQTVYLTGVTGSAGSLSQVKECTSALLRFAKQTNIPVLLIGHVTKTGEIAGPRVLEHIVDTVLYMEGERYSSHRLLRSVKNRFGSTDELGVFEMSQLGLQAVSNPSEIFLSEHHFDSVVLAGLAVAVIIDGSRTFLIEIQALCSSGLGVARHVNGIKAGRADMIIAAIFLNVVSGVDLTETAGDLAIAAAICSSFFEFPIPNDVAFIGELGLGGELRTVTRMDKRVNAVAKLGYKKCVIPKKAEKSLASIDLGEMVVVGCKDLKEVIHRVFLPK